MHLCSNSKHSSVERKMCASNMQKKMSYQFPMHETAKTIKMYTNSKNHAKQVKRERERERAHPKHIENERGQEDFQ